MTVIDHPEPRLLAMAPDTEPRTAVELMEVLDTMRAVHGPNPEAMDPGPRAVYLLDQSRLRAALRTKRSRP